MLQGLPPMLGAKPRGSLQKILQSSNVKNINIEELVLVLKKISQPGKDIVLGPTVQCWFDDLAIVSQGETVKLI
jgi:hypothetical protein